MKVRVLGIWLLFLGSACLFLGGGCGRLWAGQNYQRHVTAFGNSAAASTAPSKVDPATEADIRELLRLAGTKAKITLMLNNYFKNSEPLLTRSLPPGPYRKRLVQLFFQKLSTKGLPQHILDMAVPVYAGYFTDAEIKQLIQFYKTPLGQKWAQLGPAMEARIGAAASKWGRQMGRETMLEVLQEHPELTRQLKAAARAQHHH